MISYFGLGQADYESLRFALVLQLEESGNPHLTPYIDSVGIATIGIGFNIETNLTNRDLVFAALGIGTNETSVRSQLSSVLTTATSTSQLVSSLDAIMSARGGRPTFAFASEQEVVGVYNQIAPTYETAVDSHVGFALPADSQERAALFDLAYNNPSLIGSGLSGALSNGDRAEAFYEIRFNTNGGASASGGIAKRRYVESEVFGLHDHGSLTATDAALSVRMYTKHEQQILQYETTYSGQIASANQDLAAIEQRSGLALGTVQVIRDELATSRELLSETYADGQTFDEVWVAPDVQAKASEVAAHTVDRTAATAADDLILGSINFDGSEAVAADTLRGGDGDDVIIGFKGNDSLEGGDGNDSLAGGEGVDTIDGGAGADTLSGGAGADLIRTDGQDSIVGDASADKIVSVAGQNSLAGGAGNDLLDISSPSSGGADCTITLNPGDGHDWVEYGSAPATLTVDAPLSHFVDIEIVLDSTDRVLVQHSGSPDLNKEDPEEWTYEVDAYLKLGGDTIYIGKAYWLEYNDFSGQLAGAVLTELRNNVTVVTSDETTTLQDWIYQYGDSVGPDGFQDPYDDGIDNYDEESGRGTSGDDNVAGGSESDDLGGGRGNDTLSGGDGDDILSGGTGDDMLAPGAGNDIVYGSKGADTGMLDGVQADYTFSREADGALIALHVSTNTTDRFYDVETVAFSNGGSVAASSLAPLYGTPGLDELANSASGQSVYGFGGDDIITLAGTNNTVDGGEGYDLAVLTGQLADYQIERQADGSFTVEHLSGGGTDIMISVEALGFGSADDPVSVRSLIGDPGTPEDDYVAGTAGDDHLWGLAGNDYMVGLAGNDSMSGGDGNDYMLGGDGTDTLQGGNGNDYIDGGSGIDSISAGSGDDTIVGGAGHDIIAGGRGSDVFVFQGAFDNDIIIDFKPGTDKISFVSAGASDFSTLMSHATQSGSNVIIDLDGVNMVQLNLVDLSALSSSDFLFS